MRGADVDQRTRVVDWRFASARKSRWHAHRRRDEWAPSNAPLIEQISAFGLISVRPAPDIRCHAFTECLSSERSSAIAACSTCTRVSGQCEPGPPHRRTDASRKHASLAEPFDRIRVIITGLRLFTNSVACTLSRYSNGKKTEHSWARHKSVCADRIQR